MKPQNIHHRPVPPESQPKDGESTGLGAILLLGWLLFLITASAKAAAPVDIPVPDHFDFETLLGEYRGGFMICDLAQQRSLTFNEAYCRQRFAPCSTFKILNTLIGLETGVLRGADHFMAWDGKTRSIEAWNRDHILATAMKYSVVWYYQEVARAIGRERLTAYVNRVAYGNQDLSGPIDRFWLGDSLTISIEEQVAFLKKFYGDKLPFSPKNLALTRLLLVQEGFEGVTFSGKTGSAWQDGAYTMGWFVGHLRAPRGEYVFALNLMGGTKPNGFQAKSKVVEILTALELLPPSAGTK